MTVERISVRAYEIHISGTDGHEVENWLRAERELLAALESDDDSEGADEDKQAG